MMLINSDMKLADVVLQNYLLIPVINRFNIRLGFGDKTIKTVCDEHGVDAQFFTAVLNTFSHEDYSTRKLQQFGVLQIVDYLKKTHQYYREVSIPAIELYINQLLSDSGNNKNLEIIRKFFIEYKIQLLAHLDREDSNTFPYIEKLIELKDKPNAKELYLALSTKYSIKVFEREHDNVDEKLFDLKNILIKYLSGNFNQSLCNIIIVELFRLEKDLIDHTRIEEKVLVPVVGNIEQQLNN